MVLDRCITAFSATLPNATMYFGFILRYRDSRCVPHSLTSEREGVPMEYRDESVKGVHRILLVMQNDISSGTASLIMSRRHIPDGPINGSLLRYSDSPGASPMNSISTWVVGLGVNM